MFGPFRSMAGLDLYNEYRDLYSIILYIICLVSCHLTSSAPVNLTAQSDSRALLTSMPQKLHAGILILVSCANPARGQLNRENNIPLSPCVPESLVSRDGFSRPVPRQPAHLHTQAESGAYLRDSSRVPRRCPFMKPPYAIGLVPS